MSEPQEVANALATIQKYNKRGNLTESQKEALIHARAILRQYKTAKESGTPLEPANPQTPILTLELTEATFSLQIPLGIPLGFLGELTTILMKYNLVPQSDSKPETAGELGPPAQKSSGSAKVYPCP